MDYSNTDPTPAPSRGGGGVCNLNYIEVFKTKLLA